MGAAGEIGGHCGDGPLNGSHSREGERGDCVPCGGMNQPLTGGWGADEDKTLFGCSRSRLLFVSLLNPVVPN